MGLANPLEALVLRPVAMEFEGAVLAAAKGECENKKREELKERDVKDAVFELVQDVQTRRVI